MRQHQLVLFSKEYIVHEAVLVAEFLAQQDVPAPVLRSTEISPTDTFRSTAKLIGDQWQVGGYAKSDGDVFFAQVVEEHGPELFAD